MVPQTGPEQKDNLMMGPKYMQANSSQGIQRVPGVQLDVQEGHSKKRNRAVRSITTTTINVQHGPKGPTWDP